MFAVCQSRRPSRSLLRTISTSLLLWLGLILLLNGCGGDSELPADPYRRYRPALKEAFQSQLDELPAVPRYDIQVQFDSQAKKLHGSAQILITNLTSDPWPYLLFRLYPALRHYQGPMRLQGVAVNGKSSPFVYEANRTALRVSLSRPLEPNEAVQVRMAWEVEIPQWSDATAVYALFGQSQQMTSLPLFYPTLAVYRPGPTLGAGRWWLEEGTVRGDAAFNVTSLFVVTATLPADEVPVTSGTLISSTLLPQNQARHIWVTGPAREFVLHMSPVFRSAFTETYGTRVTSYWLPGQEAAGREALTYAITALRIYSNRFGPYPFRDLRVAPGPLSYRGMEYPQVALIGTELYTRFRNNLEILVAHEVAHQWWYQVVHNDPVNEPWLDEALAEYSVKIYMEELRGRKAATRVEDERWQLPVALLKNQGVAPLVDQKVENFTSGQQYETIIYAKGALFYVALRQTLGDRQFFRFLHNYLEKYRYQIVTGDDWLADLAALNHPGVDALYQQWVRRSAVSSTSQTK